MVSMITVMEPHQLIQKWRPFHCSRFRWQHLQADVTGLEQSMHETGNVLRPNENAAHKGRRFLIGSRGLASYVSDVSRASRRTGRSTDGCL